MIDATQVETDLSDYFKRLWSHLNALNQAKDEAITKEEKMRLSKTANIFSSKAVGLAKQARRVCVSYPRMI